MYLIPREAIDYSREFSKISQPVMTSHHSPLLYKSRHRKFVRRLLKSFTNVYKDTCLIVMPYGVLDLGSILDQVMARYLFVTNPLPAPMLTNC